MNAVKLNWKLTLYAIVSLFYSCNPDEKDGGFIIEGNISGLQSDSVYLKNSFSDITYSAAVVNEKFTFSGKVTHPDVFELYLDSTLETSSRIFVENRTITLSGNFNSPTDILINGSPLHLEQQVFEKSTQTINTVLDSVRSHFGKAWQRGDINAIDSLNELAIKLSNQKMERLVSYAKSNGTSWILPVLAYDATVENPESSWIDSMYKYVHPDLKNSSRFVNLMSIHEKTKSTAIGQQAPDFVIQTLNQGQLKLSALQGKIVLLDFWASWCGPCRSNHPDLVALYRQYRDNEFEIVSVSLDKSDNLWKEAVQKDNLTWIQACDLKGGKGEAAERYSVKFIPSSFLLDRSGKIMAKDIHGKRLRQKIAYLMAADNSH